MSGGIRVELSIDRPEECSLAAMTGVGETSHSLSKSTRARGADRVVTEEFTFDGDGPVDSPDDVDAEEMFTYGSESVYRFTREVDRGCACERVEAFGCPVADVYVDGDTLHLTFHAPDTETLSEVLDNVRDRYPSVSIDRLIRSSGEETEDEQLLLVDRGELTRRQQEVLETAHEMGYFEYPKGANATEVAEELAISASTFTEHLSVAQSKLLSSLLEN